MKDASDGKHDEDDGINSKLDSIPPMKVEFSNLGLSVAVKKWLGLKTVSSNEILKGVNGYAKPGLLLAILGTSGTIL